MTGGRPRTHGNRTANETTPDPVGCRPVPEPRCLSQVLGVAPVLPLTAHADVAFYLALGFVVGLSAIYFGAKQWRVGKILQNTPTERIRSVAVGRTEVEGTCRDVGLTVHEPYGDRECVYRHWEIQEHRPVDDQATDDWVTVDSGTDVAPFFVEDETGRILVDTTDAPHFEISETNSVTIEVGEGDPPPPGVASFHGLQAPTNDGRERSADGIHPGTADDATGEDDVEEAASMSRERLLEAHVDDRLLDADGDLRPEVTAVQLQRELEDVPGVTVSDLFGGTTGGSWAGTEGGDERAEDLDPDAIVSELGGRGEAGDLGTGSSLAREFIEGGIGSVTGGRFGIGSSVIDLDRGVGALDASHDRRFSQAVLPVGDPVYVYGAAERRTTDAGANQDRLKLVEDPATGQFILSDHDESGIASQYTNRGPLYVAGGLVVSTGCLAGLLMVFGVG